MLLAARSDAASRRVAQPPPAVRRSPEATRRQPHPQAGTRAVPEGGLHVFRHSARKLKCLVDISDSELAKYLPPQGIDRRGAIGAQPLRRSYDMEHETADDERLGKRLQAPDRGLDHLVAFLAEEWLRQSAERLTAG